MVIVKHCIVVAGEQPQLTDHDKIMQHEMGALQVESLRHKEERTIHSRDHGCQDVRGRMCVDVSNARCALYDIVPKIRAGCAMTSKLTMIMTELRSVVSPIWCVLSTRRDENFNATWESPRNHG